MRLFFLLLAVIPTLAVAQLDNCYVIRNEGDTLTGSSLIYNDLILKDPFFKLDDIKLELSEIRLVRNNHGIFANVSELTGGKEQFAMRVVNGKISVLEAVDMRIYGGDELPRWFDSSEERRNMASGKMHFYMNEKGEAKKPTYQNLKVDLASNTASMDHLKKSRMYQWLKRGMVSTGGSLLAVSFWQMEGGFVMSPRLLIAALLTGGSFLFDNPINDERWMAVEEYNED